MTSLSPLREYLLIAILSTTQALQEASLGIVIAALHPIGESFGVPDDSGQQSWFAASYALTVGTFILPAGRWGDVYGYKTMLLIGWAWFAVWSVVTGVSVLSKEVIFFDVCRALQGIGPALIIPNAVAIIGRMYPEESLRKNIVFGLYGSLAPAGFVFGCLLGSLFGQLSWWPWAFWTLSFLCLLMAVATIFVVPASLSSRPDRHIHAAELDLIGTALSVTGLILVNFAWNQAYVVGWAVPYNGALLGVGVLLLVAFGWWESRAEHPLIPAKYFNVEATLTLVVLCVGFASFGLWNFYYFRFSQDVRGYSPLAVTAQNVPIIPSGALAAVCTGYLLNRFGASFVLTYAMIAIAIGSILLATAPVDETYWARTFVSMIVVPWGVDATFPASTILLANAFPQKYQGSAASIVNTLANYSISLGLGFAGTVERNLNPDGTMLLKGYRGAFYLGIGLAVLGLVIAASFWVSDLVNAKGRAKKDSSTESGSEKGQVIGSAEGCP
ncbi:unnamed protein product [Zymoseptoria tritici ST99CH_3D7]|uniref:Major facilitator superfamily (MFS) profile domain-containing protein n=1 Tax=Zymoseptoria tritici (strain ST99CH_3D7) TaxID=1276538 RepID=A0A1X7S016_ZYMT9|nr:unnamed protein product [Zymoseptoria tritici ST99CH_3D7]